MKPRILTIPVVLMLLALTVLPGICFSYNLSSSVTSYNNIISSPSSGGPIHIDSGEGFKVKTSGQFGDNEAYEIVSGSGEDFLGITGNKDPTTKEVQFSLDNNATFVIYLEIGNGQSQKFNLTVKEVNPQGNVVHTFIDNAVYKGNSTLSKGYVKVGPSSTGILENAISADNLFSYESPNEVVIDVTGTSQNKAPIKLYVVFVSSEDYPS